MYYLHTKDGAADVLGLKSVSQLRRYIKRAEKLGLKPSKKKWGIEYFDVDVLKNPHKYTEEKEEHKELEIAPYAKRKIQLTLPF